MFPFSFFLIILSTSDYPNGYVFWPLSLWIAEGRSLRLLNWVYLFSRLHYWMCLCCCFAGTGIPQSMASVNVCIFYWAGMPQKMTSGIVYEWSWYRPGRVLPWPWASEAYLLNGPNQNLVCKPSQEDRSRIDVYCRFLSRFLNNICTFLFLS